MASITVYQKPTCSKCRQLHKLLTERGSDFDSIDYYIEPISKSKLASLLEKMGAAPHDVMRAKENIYKELKIAEGNFSNDELIDLMIEHPDLMQRPIVEIEDKAVLARPVERINEIL